MLDRDLIEEIRTANDIVSVASGYVQLKRSGSSLVGLCPFHKEKTPSFHVNSERQSFHCYGCGAGGNIITFVMMIENYEFLDAVKFLADKANIAIEQRDNAGTAGLFAKKRKELYEIHKNAARFFYDCLNSDGGAFAADYIKNRGLTAKTLIKCGVGYNPKNEPTLYRHLKSKGYDDDILLDSGLVVKSKSGRGFYDRFFERLMFPIFDVTGRVVGFGGRTLGDGMPKYLNSPETPIFEKGRLLYGLNFARKEKKRELIVVEGYMDAISLYQAGFMNTVASLGTAFTPYHARLLKNYADSVILLYDNDEAGVKAVYKALPLLAVEGINIRVAQLTGAKDPDDYIKAFGADKLERLLREAKNHIAFQIDRERERHDFSAGVEHKVAFTKEASKILKDVPSEIERDAYLKETSKLTGISESAIRAEMETQQGEYIPSQVPRARRSGDSQGLPKSVMEAQKRLLGLISANRAAFEKARVHISETDFTNETFKELYGQIVEFYKKGMEIRAENMTSCFETADKQQEVFEILSNGEVFLSPQLEKDFNDQIKIIKLYNIGKKKEQFNEKNDVNALQTALNEEKTVKRQYISLTDG